MTNNNVIVIDYKGNIAPMLEASLAALRAQVTIPAVLSDELFEQVSDMLAASPIQQVEIHYSYNTVTSVLTSTMHVLGVPVTVSADWMQLLQVALPKVMAFFPSLAALDSEQTELLTALRTLLEQMVTINMAELMHAYKVHLELRAI
jgi:hypothetical protein